MAIPSHPGTGVAAEGKQTLCSKGTLFHMDRRNTFRHSAHPGSDPQVNSPCPWHLK